jgi:hypothetical protein
VFLWWDINVYLVFFAFTLRPTSLIASNIVCYTCIFGVVDKKLKYNKTGSSNRFQYILSFEAGCTPVWNIHIVHMFSLQFYIPLWHWCMFVSGTNLVGLCSAPHFMIVMKSRSMRWVGHAACQGGDAEYTVLVGKHEGKKLFGRPRCR